MNNSTSNSSNASAASEPLPSRPLVLLLLDGWGVAPEGEMNALRAAKITNWLNLIKEYPVALLSTGEKTINARYLSLGTGQDLSDENIESPFSLTQALADHNLKQLKIAETERFAALTHFFNGHSEGQKMGEDWKIVSSEAGNHTVKPLLALKRTVKEVISALHQDPPYNFIAVTIPTTDLVAATGDFNSVIKTVEAVDKNLKLIIEEVLDHKGLLLISSPNGNAEKMRLPGTDVADTSITTNPVPLLIVGEEFKGRTVGLAEPLNNDLSLLAPIGTLADLAPTILSLMNLEKPAAMTGQSILDNK